jgi:hypothetical protein
MLVTALSPVIGYDTASKIAHYAMDNDLTLKTAALKLGFVTEAEFDRVVDPKKMVNPMWRAALRRSACIAHRHFRGWFRFSGYLGRRHFPTKGITTFESMHCGKLI